MASSLVTYYTVLQVEEDADSKDIRRAYLKLSLLCHPDRRPGDSDATTAFQTIREAYDCLSDLFSRRAYDRKLQQLREPTPTRYSVLSPPPPFTSYLHGTRPAVWIPAPTFSCCDQRRPPLSLPRFPGPMRIPPPVMLPTVSKLMSPFNDSRLRFVPTKAFARPSPKGGWPGPRPVIVVRFA